MKYLLAFLLSGVAWAILVGVFLWIIGNHSISSIEQKPEATE